MTAATQTPIRGLLTLEQIGKMNRSEVHQMTAAHINPGQLHYLKLLGFDRVLIDSAEGPYYIDSNGRNILDFFGGFGAVGFGHNHPRIVAARERFAKQKRPDICMAFMSRYTAGLAHNLSQLSPGSLDMVYLCNSGSEAIEAALKVCEQAQPNPTRTTIVHATNSFHGKTRGALSVTDGPLYRQRFSLLKNIKKVPFGDLEALAQLLQNDSSIAAIILETIQGGGGINLAPTTYWRGVRSLCDQYGAYWIADEIQCGMGRTGCFYAFEHHGVVPDVVTIAKSLGGSKTAMAATIVRRELFMKAFGKPKTALINAPGTFGGIGDGCATAIEALNVLYDENLIDNATNQGHYLLERLSQLASRYPTVIKQIRGQGLMIGLEFHDISHTLPAGLRQLIAPLDEHLKGSLCGFIGALLLAEKSILVAFTEYNRNVIRLEPPLIINTQHINKLIDALDDLLSRGTFGIVKSYIALRTKPAKTLTAATVS